MAGEQQNPGQQGGDIVFKDSLITAAVKWVFQQDKPTILLVLILAGVGTGCYFLGNGLWSGVPEWLAGIRAGYKEAIAEFRAEAQEQRELHDKQFKELREDFHKINMQAEQRYDRLINTLLETGRISPAAEKPDQPDKPVASTPGGSN